MLEPQLPVPFLIGDAQDSHDLLEDIAADGQPTSHEHSELEEAETAQVGREACVCTQ